MRVTQLMVNVGGKWNNSTKVIEGGKTLSSEINSLEYNLNNNLKVEFTVGAGTLGYANRAVRDGRIQKITMPREFRDFLYQQNIDLNDTFCIHCKALGPLIDTEEYYSVEMVFPRVAVIAAQIGVDGKRLSEALDLQILEDDTLGSAIVYVQNLQTKYAGVA
jgi:hypothetical protein